MVALAACSTATLDEAEEEVATVLDRTVQAVVHDGQAVEEGSLVLTCEGTDVSETLSLQAVVDRRIAAGDEAAARRLADQVRAFWEGRDLEIGDPTEQVVARRREATYTVTTSGTMVTITGTTPCRPTG